jgi:threonine/homoserine/homoserine lactone efflux protein
VPDPATFGAFAIASLLLLIIPGPAVLYIINRSVADGRTIGLTAVAGLETGTLVHVLAATLGLSAVLAASATAFTVVKWLGAGYLVYVGIRTMTLRPVRLGGMLPPTNAHKAFRQGVVVNTLNPKVALFFLSFLPQFIEPGHGAAWLQSLLLGLTFVAIAFVTDGGYALAASALREVLLRGRSLPFVQRWVAGGIYIGLGIVAATTGHTRTSTTSS